MRLRFLGLAAGGIAAAAIGLVPLDALFHRLRWNEQVPYDAAFWTGVVCAQAGLVVLGAAAVTAAFSPRFRRPGFAALAVLAAAGVAAARWPSAWPRVGLGSFERFAYWRNGSERFEATPETLAWAEDFVARLERQPDLTREACESYERLGDYYLRIGRVHNSVGCFERALTLLDANREQVERERAGATTRHRLQFLRWLGVAYLRTGEVGYCLRAPSAESCIFPLAGAGIWRNPGHAIRAQEAFLQFLEIQPENPGVRWLLNVAHMAAGTFPEGVPARFRLPAEAWDKSAPSPHFLNVAVGRTVDRFDVAGGSVMDDFDGDGLLDLVATCLRMDTHAVFYRNRGDGSFEELTRQSGLDRLSGSLSLTQADYDLDGDLDVYIGNERLRRDDFAPSELWQNLGDGTFRDVAAAAGVTNDGFARGVSWGDFDNDGDFDLYVSNFGDLNRLYRNRGDGTFEDVAPALGVAEQTPDPHKQRSFQSWFFDFDNDGWLDLFSASYPLGGTGGSVDGPAASLFGEPPIEETCRLWLNNGRGGFRDVTEEAGLLKTVSVMGADFGDVDGDGDPDLYQQLGGWFSDDKAFNALFRNDGPAVGGRWITLRLRGARSNRFGIGARVTAWIEEAAPSARCGRSAAPARRSAAVRCKWRWDWARPTGLIGWRSSGRAPAVSPRGRG